MQFSSWLDTILFLPHQTRDKKHLNVEGIESRVSQHHKPMLYPLNHGLYYLNQFDLTEDEILNSGKLLLGSKFLEISKIPGTRFFPPQTIFDFLCFVVSTKVDNSNNSNGNNNSNNIINNNWVSALTGLENLHRITARELTWQWS